MGCQSIRRDFFSWLRAIKFNRGNLIKFKGNINIFDIAFREDQLCAVDELKQLVEHRGGPNANLALSINCMFGERKDIVTVKENEDVFFRGFFNKSFKLLGGAVFQLHLLDRVKRCLVAEVGVGLD